MRASDSTTYTSNATYSDTSTTDGVGKPRASASRPIRHISLVPKISGIGEPIRRRKTWIYI